jgi:hypothetical protein
VNNTEILHSVHIISELLEAIIDNNMLGLKIAEIEGDAIFFYKKGKLPAPEVLFGQIEKMYVAFHQQLKLYDRDRICSCGACSSVNNLQLKFISHYGNIVERTIYNHFQLMGSDVTLVHKLLKNNIKEDEYFLFSEKSLVNHKDNGIPLWVKFEAETTTYEGVGEVNYKFTSLAPLQNKIPKLLPRRKFEAIDKPIKVSVNINADIKKIYALLININRKPEWMNGLKKVKFKPNRVLRVGSSHDCVLPLNTLHFETIESVNIDDELIYTEYSEDSLVFPAFYQRFILKIIDKTSTKLSVEVHYKGTFIKEAMLRVSMKNVLKTSLKKFKNLCEIAD